MVNKSFFESVGLILFLNEKHINVFLNQTNKHYRYLKKGHYLLKKVLRMYAKYSLDVSWINGHYETTLHTIDYDY